VLMADDGGARDMSLPPLPAAARRAALELLPFAVASNPLDMTAQVTAVPSGVSRTVGVMLDHTAYGTVFAYLAHVGLSPERFASTQAELIAQRQRHPDRLMVLVMLSRPEVNQALEQHGIPVFEDPSRAVRAVAALAHLRARREMLYRPVQRQAAAALRSDVSTEDGAKRVLALAGLPVLPERLCRSKDEAVAAARALGFPVVAKIVSPDIPHKTEVGGVMLRLQDAAAVEAAHEELMARAATARPDARLEGVLIAPMLQGGVEVILGIHRDPTFGPMVMYGCGGTAVELFKDVAFASAPLVPARAAALVDRVRSTQLLRGWRGGPRYDEAALIDAMCRLSDFGIAHANELESVDINPFVVRVDGAACLDAVIVLRATDAKEQAHADH